jgi:WD40 repeat protein
MAIFDGFKAGSRPYLFVICLVLGLLRVTIAAEDPVSQSPDGSRIPVEYESIPSTFAEHQTEITGMAVSPDEQFVVIGESTGRIRFYDRDSRQLRQVVAGHSDMVTALAFSPDGSQLASVGFDRQIRLWSLPDLGSVNSWDGHTSAVADVVFAPGGKTLATCGYDKTIRLWNPETGQEIASVNEQPATVRCLTFSPDGALLASGGDDNAVRIWNAESLKSRTLTLVRAIENQRGRVRDVEFSPNGQHLACIDEGGIVRLYATNDGAIVRTFNRAGAAGWRLAFSTRGDSIAAGYRNGEIRIWDIKHDRPRFQLNGHNDIVSGIAFLKGDRTIFSTSYDASILNWNARLPAHPPIARIPTSTRIWDSAFTPHGNLFAVAGQGGVVEIRSLQTGKLIRTLDAHKSTADRVRFSSDGSMVATAGWKSNEVVIRRVSDGEVVQTLTADAFVRAVAFSPAASALAAACEDGQLIVFRLANGKRLSTTAAHKMKVNAVTWSPDGKTILTCDGDWSKDDAGSLKLWDANSFTEAGQMDGHSSGVVAAIFRPDGKQAASAARSGRIKIWDVESQRELVNLGPNDGTTQETSTRLRSIEYSPDGKQIAAAMYDGTVNLWDIASKNIIRRYRGDDDTFTVRFSPDGSVLCGASGNKHVLLWDVSDLNPGPAASWVRDWASVWTTDQPELAK